MHNKINIGFLNASTFEISTVLTILCEFLNIQDTIYNIVNLQFIAYIGHVLMNEAVKNMLPYFVFSLDVLDNFVFFWKKSYRYISISAQGLFLNLF